MGGFGEASKASPARVIGTEDGEASTASSVGGLRKPQVMVWGTVAC